MMTSDAGKVKVLFYALLRYKLPLFLCFIFALIYIYIYMIILYHIRMFFTGVQNEVLAYRGLKVISELF